MSEDRYARQRLIAGWNQERLRDARVLVAGVGALGNEVLKNMALLGVGHLLLVDLDRVEPTNLSRTVLFSESDIGRPKVDAAADSLLRLNPQIDVRAIWGDLFYDVGLSYYRHSHLVIGCLDNLAARSQVGLSCSLAGVPYLDGGMWSLGGEVRWFTAGDGPCFDCTLSEGDWQRAFERRSCTGFSQADPEGGDLVPTMATTAAIVGGILSQEAVKWLCAFPVSVGKALVYNGQALTLHRSELARNPHCRSSHTAYAEVIELTESGHELTANHLFALTRAAPPHPIPEAPIAFATDFVLELGRDFLLTLNCPVCGREEGIGRLWARVPESYQTCPHCGAARRPVVLTSVDEHSPYANTPLAALGVPPGEVLAVRSSAGLTLFELKGGE